MKHFFRTLLLIFASFGVVALGYYAYILTTDTLSLPFIGQERQSGTLLQFVVAKPRFLVAGYDRNIIDQDALIQSLSLDGKHFDPTISGEGYITVSGEYIAIGSNKMTGSSVLKIDSGIYNSARSTTYRLPRDMILTETKNPKEFSITQEGEPRDRMYKVKLVGYGDLGPRDVTWYMHTNPKKNCSIHDAWNSLEFLGVPATEIRIDRDGQTQVGIFSLDFDPNISRLCIIAGIGGDFYTLEDRRFESFTATGAAPDVLSPEYDMQSRVEFQFSSDIYRDKGQLYSKEYMSHRKDQKTLFLKHLDIRPNIPLTEENIVLSPDRASIVAPFQEGQKYTISLNNLPDIYGRIVSMNMQFTPVRTPFLSLGITGRKTMFRLGEPIGAKMYALKTKKQEYPLILCQISLNGYARAERMISENDKKNTNNLYDLLESDQVLGCIKKDIVVPESTSISPFDVRQFSPSGTLQPGLYILAFRDKSDVDKFDKFISLRVLSIVDTHITMKVDASGKMQFLATDITTGEPRSSQDISLLQNIHRSYTQTWNTKTAEYDRTYLPLSNAYFSKAFPIGITNTGGILKIKKETLLEEDYNSTYGLTFESYWDFEGLYSSFLATASGGGHFGYVVSTWNDGITGWNFGLKESDYSWDNRPLYSAYIHTDRRLYLPGDTVHIHTILRKNDAKLSIPQDAEFQVRVTDPLGGIVKEGFYKVNEYGAISLDLLLPKDTHLGSYTINIEPRNSNEGYYAISNSWANFQVEVFKNPTFTAEVSLRSPDIEDDTLLNLREVTNSDTLSPWYDHVLESNFSLEGIIKAHYYNGQTIKNIPFTYRVYRSEYYSEDYWGNCFWGCFWQPSPEFYTEGTGSIDSDGFGFFRIPVAFSSFYSDYMYTAEVIIRDPMTGEEIVTPATILAKIPEKYKSYAPNNPLIFTPDKRIISQGEKIRGLLGPKFGKWNSSLEGKYKYEIVSRSYSQVRVDDLRLSDITLPTSEDSIISTGTITSSGLNLDTKGFKSGEYHVRILPIVSDDRELPEDAISDISLYIVGDFTTRSTNLQVIPEKTIYKVGETARVLITLPFTGGHVYITREKGGVIESEYLPIEGNTMVREYLVDETFVPNSYIGAVAFNKNAGTGSRSYAVGYGEIVTDLADKKANLRIETNKTTYTNKEKVDIAFLLTNRAGKPLDGEITVMVVDESLIRLLGNIDLDIIPKFFQKFPFTMKTSLTSIGIERNRFLSRKGSNGGSGDKGGDGEQISSRTLFKNTAYYNASLRTDPSGKVRTSFTLPDNVTDYRIIALAQTKNSQFGVSEKTIQVRRDYTLESHVPYILYPGDTSTITVSAFNATKKVTQANIVLNLSTGATLFTDTKEVILNPNESQTVTFPITVRDTWRGAIPYKIVLQKDTTILDSVEKSLSVPAIPILESTERKFGVFSGSKLSLDLTDATNISLLKSRVVFRISSSLAVGMDSAIRSLLVYPYGCIEQTIASTLPNALALKFNSLVSSAIDTETAKNNLDAGVKKILRMQQFGGWKYWETDTEINTHVTPYVLRSLLIFKDLGVDIPDSALQSGKKYVEDMVDYRQDLYKDDPDFASEIFWTLAMLKSDHTKLIEKSIDPKKLSRHGYLAYAYGLQILSRYTPEVDKKLEAMMNLTSSEYWYWDYGADMALYARLLLERSEIERASRILMSRMREVDLSSYYTSTQEKIQLFYTLFRHTLATQSKVSSTNIALRGEAIIADLSLNKERVSQKVEVSRGKMGDSINITRSSTIPLYYELLEYNVPDDILSTKPLSSGGMNVSREFEKIDETRGIDSNGTYLSASPVTDAVFEKGSLYRVTIRVKIPEKNTTWQHLTVEDFVPGGWRPIRSIFQTTSRVNSEGSDTYDYENYWSYIEARDDRILATVESGYGTTRTYTYYFRPEYTGVYLLPPVTAYFMYNPETHALGRYEKVTVR